MRTYECQFSLVHSRLAARTLVLMGEAPLPVGPSMVPAEPSPQPSADPGGTLQDARQEGKDDAFAGASQSGVECEEGEGLPVAHDAEMGGAEEVVADWMRSTYQGLEFPPGMQSVPTFACIGEEGVCTSSARSCMPTCADCRFVLCVSACTRVGEQADGAVPCQAWRRVAHTS